MKSQNKLIPKLGFTAYLGLASIALTVGQVKAATILVNDAFNDGGVTNGSDPLDASWVGIASTQFQIRQFQPPGNTSNSGEMWTYNNPFKAVKGVYTPQTLLVNESIVLTLDFRMASTPVNVSSGIRFGLGSSTESYGIGMGTGTSGGVGIARYVTVDALSGTNTAMGTGTFAGISNSTIAHTLTFTLTRTAAGSLSAVSSIDGVNFFAAPATATGVSNFSFDRILLSNGAAVSSTTNNVLIDNIQLSVVPEPSPALLFAAAGVLGMIAMRRYRHTGNSI